MNARLATAPRLPALARTLLAAGAALGALAVAAGAFGAHALRGALEPAQLAVFETAARYQMFHALALLGAGALALHTAPSRLLAWSGGCLLAGTLVFSGSLYLMVVTGVRALGAVTPAGGVLQIAGWGLLAAAAWSARRPADDRLPND